ncbi:MULTISPECIES: glycosyltransferase family 8 protein [unclassified Brenneria]|uniref:glycosyltransferase family 8 protein n=1 Tax=unclassified Brenneria TaxID=2634434 RepID=UPI0018F0C63F|nr:glycosyltransferase [Brenneria sp. L3-3C-1]MBJ7223403.1 lipopolysaccharide 1,2-glucosyltransferase [Brenneria sp. L3-3C-1]MEE3644643.1 glycosyltransferase [Brenneria sp. L3_3C_1]
MYFNKELIIEDTIKIIGNNNSDEPFLHVAYGIDKKFIFGSAISATSILINNNIPLFFHFFTDYIDEDTIHRFKSMAEKFHTNVHIYKVNTSILKELPQERWPCSAYFRIVAFDYLSDKIDKLLYLDADIMCKGDLSALTDIDFSHAICAIVPDIQSTQEQAAIRLRKPELAEYYFNSGVMFTQLKNWNEYQLTQKTLSFILDNLTLRYPDQDALNVLLYEKTIILPRKFNSIYSIKSELKDKSHQAYKEIITPETILIHYVGTTKPWNEWGQYPSTVFFKKAYHVSTWCDVPLTKAVTPLQWKKKSKHEIRQGKYIKGILSRLKYKLNK